MAFQIINNVQEFDALERLARRPGRHSHSHARQESVNIIIDQPTINYPILAISRAVSEQNRARRIDMIVCTRQNAKRLVYWKTSKPSRDMSQELFYKKRFIILMDESHVKRYISRADAHFNKELRHKRQYAQAQLPVVSRGSARENETRVIKMGQRAGFPILVACHMAGFVEGGKLIQWPDFLSISMQEAKRLVYWKKEDLNISTPNGNGYIRIADGTTSFNAVEEFAISRGVGQELTISADRQAIMERRLDGQSNHVHLNAMNSYELCGTTTGRISGGTPSSLEDATVTPLEPILQVDNDADEENDARRAREACAESEDHASRGRESHVWNEFNSGRNLY